MTAVGARTLSRRIVLLMLPMMAASALGQAVAQTDLLVLATLGEQAVAAAGIPARLLLIDAVTAMAIGPLVGILVAGSKEDRERQRNIGAGLWAAAGLGTVIMVVGVPLVRPATNALVEAQSIADMTETALWWLLIATPLRLSQFVGAMVLFALQRGPRLLRVYGVAVVANAVLDIGFVHGVGLGFGGVYAATFLIALGELVATLWLLRDQLPGRLPLGEVVGWIRSIWQNVAKEWLRIVATYGSEMVMAVVLASSAAWVGALAGFSAGMALEGLLLVPLIALVNATAIEARRGETAPAEWRTFRRRAGTSASVVAACWLVFALTVAVDVYSMTESSAPWLLAFLVAQSASLPFRALSATDEGVHKASERFGRVLRVRVIHELGISLPLFLVGLALGSPWVAWSGIALGSGVSWWLLRRSARPLESVGERPPSSGQPTGKP